MTRRQQIITQMREALGQLQSPAYFDYNETLTFTVADVDFEFDKATLDEDGAHEA